MTINQLKSLRWVALAALVFIGIPAARADQCAYVSREMAEQAVKIISAKRKALEFCEPCGDTVPGKPFRIETVSTESANWEDYWKIKVNGNEIDLAYFYIKTGLVTFTNAASLVNCPAEGVTQSLIPFFPPKRD